ncbi:spore germination lipoprotein GerD [Longirhabdus pacifica]|uniref:spore germination lipoprotein GerD n=1 Tax=Longirhabdus pacifica TaxID=2305227 RepID=UPI001008D39A|nr:spore germination lipoprotein GerD [Longirhabdus pacifica]
MRIIHVTLLSCLFILMLSGCNNNENQSMSSYKEMKSLVVDILKTEDGKKAIEEVTKEMENGKKDGQIMKMLTSENGQQIQFAVNEVLTSDSYQKTLQSLIKEPKFIGEFAKAIKNENKDIQKELLKDPDYQKLMLTVMQDQEYEKLLIDVMKGKQYRQQTMTIMEESLQSPLFRLQLMEIMKAVMKEESEPKSQQKEDGGESEQKSEDQQQ